MITIILTKENTPSVTIYIDQSTPLLEFIYSTMEEHLQKKKKDLPITYSLENKEPFTWTQSFSRLESLGIVNNSKIQIGLKAKNDNEDFTKVPLHLRSKKKNTPLHIATQCGPYVVRALLERKADVNTLNTDGESPLIMVARSSLDKEGDFDSAGIVRELIRYEADVNIVADVSTALHWTFFYPHTKILQQLIDAKALLNYYNPSTSELYNISPPLYDAVNYENVNAVRALIGAGAQINNYQYSSLMCATNGLIEAKDDTETREKYAAIMELLVSSGADIEILKETNTPIHEAFKPTYINYYLWPIIEDKNNVLIPVLNFNLIRFLPSVLIDIIKNYAQDDAIYENRLEILTWARQKREAVLQLLDEYAKNEKNPFFKEARILCSNLKTSDHLSKAAIHNFFITNLKSYARNELDLTEGNPFYKLLSNILGENPLAIAWKTAKAEAVDYFKSFAEDEVKTSSNDFSPAKREKIQPQTKVQSLVRSKSSGFFQPQTKVRPLVRSKSSEFFAEKKRRNSPQIPPATQPMILTKNRQTSF